jgi:hypothetical protein
VEEVKLPVKRGSLATTQDDEEEDDSMDIEGQSHSRTQDTSTNSGSRQEVRPQHTLHRAQRKRAQREDTLG